MVQLGVQIYSFACVMLVSLAPFVEKTSFLIKWSWTTCQKLLDHRLKGLFLDSHSISLIHMSMIMMITHSYNYYSSVVSFSNSFLGHPVLSQDIKLIKINLNNKRNSQTFHCEFTEHCVC